MVALRVGLVSTAGVLAHAASAGLRGVLRFRLRLAPIIKLVDEEAQNRRHADEFRLAIIEGHFKAFDLWTEFTSLFLASPDERSAVEALQRPPFAFTKDVAGYLLSLRMGRATEAGRAELENEAAELRRKITEGD